MSSRRVIRGLDPDLGSKSSNGDRSRLYSTSRHDGPCHVAVEDDGIVLALDLVDPL